LILLENRIIQPQKEKPCISLYYEQQNCLDGVQELMKNLWLIIDNPKIEVKERMKAMNLIMHCYYMRSKLIDSEAFIKEFLDYTKKVQRDEEALRIREQEISRREKSLERELKDYLKNEKLTQREYSVFFTKHDFILYPVSF
jgi:hypothetical protein